MRRAIKNLMELGSRKPVPVGQTPHEVVHKENKWRLLHFPSPKRKNDTPILLVPSLINRWYVLDLMKGRSLVEWLTEQGFEVFVLDWGTPTSEDRFLTFDDFVGAYLRRALRRTCKASGTEKAHVLGYCMGGTLAAIHAAVYPDRIESLTALAAPVDFAKDDGLLKAWTESSSFDVHQFVDAFGNAPWPLLQAAFHLLRPTLSASKATYLVDRAVLDRAYDDEFLNGFFAKEQWASDNVSLPGEVFRTWIQDVYRDNGLINGTLKLEGRRVDLSQITLPLHLVTFEDDTIVSKNSAQALATAASSTDLTVTHLRGGHVGAVVSSSAQKRLWPQLADWWTTRARAVSRS